MALQRSPKTFLFPVIVMTLASACPSFSAPSDQYSWDRMQAALENLRNGETDVKRDIAEDAEKIFAPLFDLPPGRDKTDAREVVDALRYWTRMERDDWIPTRLLRRLGERGDSVLEPLFLDALASPSPNLNWVAIQWLWWHQRGEARRLMEGLWPHEDRPWVQADLIDALVLLESQEYAADLVHLASSDDPDLAEAAVRALSRLKVVGAVPALMRIATGGRMWLRPAALQALAAWADEPEVLDLLLNLSHSDDTASRLGAIRSLGESGSSEAGSRLRALASSPGDHEVRIAAVRALSMFDRDVALPILVNILHQPAPDNDDALRSEATRGLMEIDDPSTLEALADVEEPEQGSFSKDLKTLRESLGRNRAIEGRREIISIRYGEEYPTRDPSDPRARVIVPPPWLQTVRCWETPGVAGDPEDFPRLPAGTPVAIGDHFELSGESWAEVDSHDSPGCWTPLRFIESPAANASSNKEGRKEDTMVIRREFDLPAGEVESDVSQGLMDAGLLEVIEPGDEVIGVAITIDAEDFDRVLLLARSCGLNETMLDAEIYEIVADLAPLYRGHPVLDRFRRAPQVKPATTDEVIDLDLDETTDE